MVTTLWSTVPPTSPKDQRGARFTGAAFSGEGLIHDSSVGSGMCV
jgi:hypothetical protein